MRIYYACANRGEMQRLKNNIGLPLDRMQDARCHSMYGRNMDKCLLQYKFDAAGYPTAQYFIFHKLTWQYDIVLFNRCFGKILEGLRTLPDQGLAIFLGQFQGQSNICERHKNATINIACCPAEKMLIRNMFCLVMRRNQAFNNRLQFVKVWCGHRANLPHATP